MNRQNYCLCGAKAKEYIIDAFDLKEDSEKDDLKGSCIQKETADTDSGKVNYSSRKKRGKKDMAKQIWKPGNMLYPLPAVMVSTADKSGKSNIITVAWTGTVCTESGNAVHIRKTGAIFVRSSERQRRVRSKSDN